MTRTPKRKGGRKVATSVASGRGSAFQPTEHQRQAVAALVSFGTKNEVIAEVIQVPERTLVRHFAQELKHGRELIHARIGGSITAAALAGNEKMQIFYAKAQMKWQERHSVGFENEKGEPVSPANLFTVSIT
jgi:hypothetical protein